MFSHSCFCFIKHSSLFFLVAAGMLSCRQGEKEKDRMIKVLTERLERSDKSITNFTRDNLNKLENDRYEPAKSYRASEWYPRAMQADSLSKAVIDLLQEYKKEATAGGQLSTARLKQMSSSLYARIKQLDAATARIDSGLYKVFKEEIAGVFNLYAKEGESADALSALFISASGNSVFSELLSVFINRVVLLGERMVQYCKEQVGVIIDRFYSYTAIVAQSSTVVKPGEEISITSGLGAFSAEKLPEILINGSLIALNDGGTAQYKVKAPAKPGQYEVPVIIKFIDEDGEKRENKYTVSYSVANICN